MTSEPLEAYYRAELLLSAVSELPARARTKLDDTFDTKALALTTLQANANVQMYRKQCEALDTEHSRVPTPLICPTIESADPNSTPHSHSPTQLLVVPFIERYLYEKCVTICGFLHADRDISQLENLPIHIMKSKLSAEETHCQNLRKEMIKTLTVELDAYKAMICKLVHMLSTFKQLEMPQYLARKTRWLHTLSTLFQTQVQLYRYQLLEQTYTCTKVDTLCKLSAILSDRKARAHLKRQTLETQLQMYRNNGNEFQRIAKSYKSIQKRIDEKKNWMQTVNQIQ